ncbi:MAG TPA: 6,7-dimethyl-8-ribityllumazine synthase [Burkholderiaceae bacterium]|nr:6,7-dimethyl-8-ribityllumazine synthase [Burkholderiaceae bacterium]
MNQRFNPPATDGASGAPAVAPGTRVAVISSSWHRDIVSRLREALLAELALHHLPASQVDQFEVPGAFEIPLQAKKLARTGRYDAIVACGLVVDGGIYRHEFVATAVIDGLMRVQLETEVPVLSAVLTPKEFHEHEDHIRFFSEHFAKKGTEAAQACLRTIASLQTLPAGRQIRV